MQSHEQSSINLESTVRHLVETFFTAPAHLDHTELASLRRAEALAAGSLQKRGIIEHLWRDLDSGAAWGIWNIPDGEELVTYQSELPCFQFMQVTIYRLTNHPNRLLI